MKKFVPKEKALITIIFFLSFFTGYAQIEEIRTGSFIVNMGVTPQTYNNGIKSWGMIHDLIKNYRVQVKWVISPVKVKDGIDFSYNGIDYKGGTFIIPAKFRSTAVNARISYWQSQGVIGNTTTSPFNVNVSYNLKYSPRWTFDFQNGSIALDFLKDADIPSASYPKKYPNELNTCDDIFVMPHADPTWSTHSNLLTWNQNSRGWIWAGCHAVSVLENLVNPLDSTQKMNFLSQNGLVHYGSHADGTPPYQYRFPNDAEMQFMGVADAAMQNGSEQIFLPKTTTWRTTTKVAAYNLTHPNVPLLSPGEAAAIVYGRAFGDSSRGKVMYEGGHNINKGNADAVAAMRAFFNFSYMSVYDKAINPNIIGPINLTSLTTYTYRAVLPVGNLSSNYTYNWTSSCGGTFSNPFDTVTVFTAPMVSSCTNCTITCTITDGCGRQYYQDFDIEICSVVPPVALDRSTPIITNPNGTGAQPIGDPVPLAGTDEDGFVTTYIIKTLPAGGVLFYDHDDNVSTPDVVINTLPGGELLLTPRLMKTLKFDPADGFAGNASFTYTVADNSGLRDLSPATYIIPVNPPPVAITKICTPVASNADMTAVCNMEATDNGSIVSYTVVSVPPATQCTVFVNKVPLFAGQILTPLQATQLTFKPSGTYVGYSEILYTATDNNGASDLTPATLTLQLINQPPEAKNIASSAIANPVGTVQFSIPALVASDKDGSIVSYIITSIPAETQGVLYYNHAGSSYLPAYNSLRLTTAQATTLKFDPADNMDGMASFQYSAKDNLGLIDNTPATFVIPVKQVSPFAHDTTNVSIYTGESWKSIADLAATDPDASNIITQFKVLTVPAASEGRIGFGSGPTLITPGMLLTTTQARDLKFDPVLGFTGTTSFTYTAKDNEGLWDESGATYNIPVHNLPPVAPDIINALIGKRGGSAALSAINGSDPEGKPLKSGTIVSLPDPQTGTLYLSGTPIIPGQTILPAQASSVSFVPNTTNNNRDTAVFLYTVTDEGDLTDLTPATFKIPIADVLATPVSRDTIMQPVSIRPIANWIPALNGTDADGTIVSFRIQTTTSPFDGTLYLDGAALTNNSIIPYEKRNQLYFIPSGTTTGTTFFRYKSVDNDGLLSNNVYNYIPIVNANPIADNRLFADVKKNTTVKLSSLSAVDTDGVIASYTIRSLPTLAHVLQCDLNGTNNFSNVAVNQALTPIQASRLRMLVNNNLGVSEFTFSATDNSGGISNIATFSIPVTGSALNQRPQSMHVSSSPVQINAGQTFISPLSAIDVDGSINSFTIVNIPPDFYGRLYYNVSGSIYDSIMIGSREITLAQAATLKFRPSGIFAGNVTFTYSAKDNNSASSELATFTIPVTCPDPVAADLTNAAVSSKAGPVILQPLSATTLGSIKGFYITDLPLKSQGVLVMDGSPVSTGQFIPAIYANRLEFDPEPTFSGTASFRYSATDMLGSFDKTPAIFSIPVVNSAPFTIEGVSQVITNTLGSGPQAIPALKAMDNDGTISSFTIKTLPTNGVLFVSGVAATVNQVITSAQAALLTFDPADNFAGTTTFTFSARDNSNNNSANAVYSIICNLPPVSQNVYNAGMLASQGITAILPLQATDDGSVVSFTIFSLPAAVDGVLYLNTTPVTSLSQVASLTPAQVNQLKFSPSANFKGAFFTYSATDNLGIIDVTPSIYQIPYGNSATLPISISAFTGNKSAADNILTWTTSQELNASHFELERSTDGRKYNKITSVSARGNSATHTEYNYVDKNVTATVAYYRLKMVDIDGSFKYSQIVVIKRDQDGIYISTIAPNPFKDRFAIDLVTQTKGTAQILIYSTSGTLVKTLQAKTIAGMNHIEITDLSGLSNGVYMLRIISNETELKAKLLKAE